MGRFALGASFFFFWIANLCLLLTALTMIGLGAYIWHITDNISFFDIGIVVLGGLEIMLVLLACCSKDNKSRLKYIFKLLDRLLIFNILKISNLLLCIASHLCCIINSDYYWSSFRIKSFCFSR